MCLRCASTFVQGGLSYELSSMGPNCRISHPAQVKLRSQQLLLEQSDKRLEGMMRQLQALQAVIAEAPVADQAARDRHMEADIAGKEAQLNLLHRLLKDNKSHPLQLRDRIIFVFLRKLKLAAGAAAFLVPQA